MQSKFLYLWEKPTAHICCWRFLIHIATFLALPSSISLFTEDLPDAFGEVFLGGLHGKLSQRNLPHPLCEFNEVVTVNSAIPRQSTITFVLKLTEDLISSTGFTIFIEWWCCDIFIQQNFQYPIHEKNTLPKLRPLVRSGERKREAANREKKNIILEISLPSKFQVQVTQFKAVNRAMLVYHIDTNWNHQKYVDSLRVYN